MRSGVLAALVLLGAAWSPCALAQAKHMQVLEQAPGWNTDRPAESPMGAGTLTVSAAELATQYPIFEVDPSWPKLPNNWVLGHVAGVATDRHDHVWLLHRPRVVPEEAIPGPPDAPEGGGNAVRNPGWQNGIRIGSARDGSLHQFIPNTRPEGMGADDRGIIYSGLTGGCDQSPSGGCLQKFIKEYQR